MKPIVLLILDGWGLSSEIKGNAIFGTQTPNFDFLLSRYPYTSLHASGEEVGLSWGEIGNSEVGHLNIGTGRVVKQDLPRIDQSISDGTFFNNAELLETITYCKENHTNLHLFGLFSSGGVHSHMNHLLALLDLAKMQQVQQVYIHLISDGRDTPQKIILQDLTKLEQKIKEIGLGQIASVMGRYWAMDRDKRWERVEKAFNVLTGKNCLESESVASAVELSYKNNITDEFINPVAIKGVPRVAKGDAVVFFNYRSDRAKEISSKILEIPDVFFTSFTSYGYESSSRVKVAFFAEKYANQLAMLLSQQKQSQLHIAETEKYPHVTYFFNGGWEEPFSNEERILIPSPKVATYDLQPEMSVKEIVAKFQEHFVGKKPAFTVCNFANPDMVGHTGDFIATQKAIKATDEALGSLMKCVFENAADLIVTADHGNAEQMINLQTGEVDKEHTTNPVPLILALEKKKHAPIEIGIDAKVALAAQQPIGVLADVTATVTNLLSLSNSPEISGQSLVNYL